MPDAAVDGRPDASLTSSAAIESCAGYAVYDPVGQKIGSAEEVFVNQEGEPVYIKVRIGLLWMRRALIPVQFVETDEEKQILVLK
jgi:galactokinase